jgi:hypothetical protein
MQQEILTIPEHIGEYTVTTIGIYRSEEYRIRSDNLKKIYIPQTVYAHIWHGLPIAKNSIECKEMVFLLLKK